MDKFNHFLILGILVVWLSGITIGITFTHALYERLIQNYQSLIIKYCIK